MCACLGFSKARKTLSLPTYPPPFPLPSPSLFLQCVHLEGDSQGRLYRCWNGLEDPDRDWCGASSNTPQARVPLVVFRSYTNLEIGTQAHILLTSNSHNLRRCLWSLNLWPEFLHPLSTRTGSLSTNNFDWDLKPWKRMRPCYFWWSSGQNEPWLTYQCSDLARHLALEGSIEQSVYQKQVFLLVDHMVKKCV